MKQLLIKITLCDAYVYTVWVDSSLGSPTCHISLARGQRLCLCQTHSWANRLKLCQSYLDTLRMFSIQSVSQRKLVHSQAESLNAVHFIYSTQYVFHHLRPDQKRQFAELPLPEGKQTSWHTGFSKAKRLRARTLFSLPLDQNPTQIPSLNHEPPSIFPPSLSLSHTCHFIRLDPVWSSRIKTASNGI